MIGLRAILASLSPCHYLIQGHARGPCCLRCMGKHSESFSSYIKAMEEEKTFDPSSFMLWTVWQEANAVSTKENIPVLLRIAERVWSLVTLLSCQINSRATPLLGFLLNKQYSAFWLKNHLANSLLPATTGKYQAHTQKSSKVCQETSLQLWPRQLWGILRVSVTGRKPKGQTDPGTWIQKDGQDPEGSEKTGAAPRQREGF